MAGPRQPTNLVLAKGKKHLTKDEIATRLAAEVQPRTEDITAPAYLTATQKKEFNRLAGQLQKLNIMGETDCGTLARYVTAQAQYEKATKELRALKPPQPTGDPETDAVLQELYYKNLDTLARLQDRYFKQAQAAARSLSLTITDRCRIVVPVKEEAPKQNKFARFGGD